MSPSGHSHDHSGHSHGEMNEHSTMASHGAAGQMNHNMEGGHAVRELSGLLASDWKYRSTVLMRKIVTLLT